MNAVRDSFAHAVEPLCPSGPTANPNVPDEKRFEAEVRPLDSDIGAVKAAQEKLEARVEKKLDVMHGDIKELRKELKGDITRLDAKVDRLEARLWWVFGAVMVSILVPIALQYFAK
ncbi:MAG: hypothetical protein LBR38_05205 [Synergistaceae bacterium]|jgi:hypothetical protein|nr:hypothetical protein [Synergistaceae bacterium]